MNKKILIGSIIAVIILIGISFTSVVGFHSVKFEVEDEVNKEISIEKDFVKSKELLFETIIEIADNPEVKELYKDNNQNLIFSDYDNRGVSLQLLKQKFISPFRMIFHKPSLSYDYLNFIYNYGCEIINILGEETALELIASVEITNKEIFQELKNIVINNEELSNNIVSLKKMNEEIISITDLDLQENPIICLILAVVMVVCIIISTPFDIISGILIMNEFMGIAFLIMLILSPIALIFLVSMLLFFGGVGEFDCLWDIPPLSEISYP